MEKALTAATRDDVEGERRSPTQKRADAMVEICRSYLEGLDNPGGNRRTERLTITADIVVIYRAWLRALGVRTAAELDSVPLGPARTWARSTGACSSTPSTAPVAWPPP